MRPRIELDSMFREIEGVKAVYFQPPESVKLIYPCIIYQEERSEAHHADDLKYIHKKRYQVMVLDKNPDSRIPNVITEFEYCAYDRFYTADNINHFVFTLYF